MGAAPFGLLLITFLLSTVDLSELQTFAIGASPALVIGAYLIGVVNRILMAYKWNLLLRAQGILISLTDATLTYLMSTFLGLFLPATVGGDAMRVLAVSKRGYSAADTTSTIILERGLGLLALMLMVVVSILVGGLLVGSTFVANMGNILLGVALLGGIATAVFFLSFTDNIKNRLSLRKIPQGQAAQEQAAQEQKSWLQLPWLQLPWSLSEKLGLHSNSKLGRFLVKLVASYQTYQDKQRLLLSFFLLSLLENLFPIAWSYSLALAFQLQVSLLDCFVVVPSVLILRRLPLSIDGIGVHESALSTSYRYHLGCLHPRVCC